MSEPNSLSRAHAEEVIMTLATRQHGVVARGQLVRAGVSADTLDHRVRTGRLRKLHRGVYLVGPLRAAQTRATATNVPVIPHEAVPNFFKNPPGIYTGENMGIATNSKGSIYIYHRAYETRLFEYTPQGQFVREIGRNNYGFAFAHSVRVDAQDNIWAVDEGTDMLVKFSPEGKVLMTIGRREDPEIRACAAMALGRIKTPSAQQSLQKAMAEKEAIVRNAVNRALKGGGA